MKRFFAGRFNLLILDFAALQIAFAAIFALRYPLGLIPPEQPAAGLNYTDYLVPNLIVTLCWLLLFTLFKFYRPEPVRALFEEVTRVITAVSVGVMVFAFLLYSTAFPLAETRLVVFVYWAILLGLLVSARIVYFRVLQPAHAINAREYQAGLAAQRRLVLVLLDLLFIIVSYWGAYQLRFGGVLEGENYRVFANTFFMVVIVRFTLFAYLRVYSGLYRYASIDDLLQIIKAVGIGTVLLVIPIFFIPIQGFPRAVLLIDSLVLIMLTGGLRLGIRFGRELMPNVLRNGKRVLVIGAGDAGEMILREMRKSKSLNYNPVGLVDDDPAKKGMRIHGVPVLGDQSDLPQIVVRHKVEEIIITIPSATNSQMRRIVENCRRLRIPSRTLPPLKEIMNDSVSLVQVREPRVEDLLGREPVNLDLGLIRQFVANKRILVTGAAGSIGSEICRQILAFAPQRLVLVDRAENRLHNLQYELGRLSKSPKDFIVADICNPGKLEAVFDAHRPDIVYHAAAFKQVPLMEAFPEEAVFNNIFGTRCVLNAALRFQSAHFILISTDKAVNPTSVMGASKKVAELLAGSAAAKGITNVVTVRFGNVLGSDGSVVPLFKRQIESGGPVTVTDPEISRYFMTIREAALLVMEASAVGRSGQVVVLKMGEPIKILDLANLMITLEGKTPNEEIKIEFIGLRPGEKLNEELFVLEDRLVATDHDKILVAEPPQVSREFLENALQELHLACERLDRAGIIAKLREMLPSYVPLQAVRK